MKTTTPKTKPTEEQIKYASRVVSDIAAASTTTAIEQLIADGQLDLDALQRVLGKADRLKARFIPFLKDAIVALAAVVKGCLKLISGGTEIEIGETDGKETLAEAHDVFTGYVDSDLKNWGTNKPGVPTNKTKVQVYEMEADSDFKGIFGSFDAELDSLCLTQSQIKSFAKNHRDWLRKDGYATFFLFKVDSEVFVAYVYVSSDGRLGVDVDRFGHGACVWHGEFRHRVVVPQQALGV